MEWWSKWWFVKEMPRWSPLSLRPRASDWLCWADPGHWDGVECDGAGNSLWWRLKTLSETRKVELFSYADGVQVGEKQVFVQNDGGCLKGEGWRRALKLPQFNISTMFPHHKYVRSFFLTSHFHLVLNGKQKAFLAVSLISCETQTCSESPGKQGRVCVINIHLVSAWNLDHLFCPRESRSWLDHLLVVLMIPICLNRNGKHVSFNWTHASTTLVLVVSILVSHGKKFGRRKVPPMTPSPSSQLSPWM